MRDPVQSPGTDLQRWLSDYLYAETLHSLGSYQYACEKLDALQGELGHDGNGAVAAGVDGAVASALAEAVKASVQCNENLRNRLHRAPELPGSPDLDRREHLSSRRPSPFSEEDEAGRKREFAPDTYLLGEIATFYRDSEAALQLFRADRDAAKGPDAPGAKLGAKLAFIHDPQRRGTWSTPQPNSLIDGKIGRTRARLEEVEALRGEAGIPAGSHSGDDDSARRDRFRTLLNSHAGGRHRLLPTIIQAFSDAHMWMHKAENVRARGFGEMFTKTPETHAKAERMLRYALALNTFVFVGARAACWIFAEDEVEQEEVIEDYENCCDRLAPTYCMWIAAQFSLLSLHRRAFTSWTRGEHDVAYRDFHKMTRLLRGLRRPAQKRGLRVPGTNTFIEGMTAMSELHIGRIYRGQHAYRMALRYFKRASRHAKGWEDDEVGHLMNSSHWRINLFLNEGKADFELGHHKRSILQYAKAWRAFLQLVQSETHAAANVNVVNDFIKWLEPVVDDPEMGRTELRDSIEPLVEQFVTLRTPVHLRLLAADIVMRMGHLIFILRLPHRPEAKALDGRGDQRHHQLAADCVEQALFLDPTSTLAATDLLNILEARAELEAVSKPSGEDPAASRDLNLLEAELQRSQRTVPLRFQWPSGGGAFEDAARITELTLQRWLASTVDRAPGDPAAHPELSAEQKIAQGLLRSFLTHTDSSNMKLAQVYGYLMRGRTPKPQMEAGQHALDFVCLRRYSSFFPFLPRPAAFRASGGGYLVQVHEPGPAEPFGIAIDPGPDFIENLYSCGYSIADVHMIILTHDHADHIASVDALLALMGIRRDLGDSTFNQDKKRCLTIVGNESVRRRYAHFGKLHPVKRVPGEPKKRAPRSDAVRVLGFDKIAEITAYDDEDRSQAIEDAELLLRPRRLRIEPVRTWGHTDANGYPSQGFLLRTGPVGDEASILFSGDTGSPQQEELRTGHPPRPELYARGSGKKEKDLLEAAGEADIVVAHLSAVPLKELRLLSGLDSGAAGEIPAVREYRELWNTAAAQAELKSPDGDEREGVRRTKFLLNQVQFGFRSRPDKRGEDLRVSPFTDVSLLRRQPERHLYLTGLIEIAERMKESEKSGLLLVGELREELGTFRTQIARRVRDAFFAGGTGPGRPSALTTDIGLRVRLSGPASHSVRRSSILCSTCDLDNDLLDTERYHPPEEIHELCVKGEDEAVFYNCSLHDPRHRKDDYWVESVERFNVFGD
jgi:glyoxylase-like metal-dependent hydrolase (beta-lactamase superfamily II)/tetratricopeptide (TPR) repeat protein